MKESTAYQLAIMAIVNYSRIREEDKVDALRILFDKERVALYVEGEEEKENG